MKDQAHPARVVWITTVCTALALFGDSTLYAVLPSQYQAVGITALQVGALLSMNRLVRLPLNLPSGWLSDRLGPKWPYVAGLACGFVSTLGYGLARGYAPLLALRLLWGVAWSLLAVAAYGMVLTVSHDQTRGRYSGIYGSFSYGGGAVGAMLGGVLVDALGFATAMLVLGGLSSLACLVALTLPNVRAVRKPAEAEPARTPGLRVRLRAFAQGVRALDARLWLIVMLNFVHRFFFAGVFYSTLGLYLRRTLGEGLSVGVAAIGVASLTATLLLARNIITILVGPTAGYLSDRLGDRRRVLLLGEAMGVAGLGCLALGSSLWLAVAGTLLIAGAYGLVPSMLVAWMGDLAQARGRHLIVGWYQTLGDLGSGLAPLIAYALIETLGIRPTYALAAALLAATIPFILRARGNAQGGARV